MVLTACTVDKEPMPGAIEPENPDKPVAGQNGIVPVTVLDYKPAPGQFINETPEYAPGDTYATILQKVQGYIDRSYLVSLGSLGGSITLRLHKPISNVPGQADFRILGNAFLNTPATAERPLGACEPGLVYVSSDDNGNHLTDDQWYLLPGQNITKATVETVTYTLNPSGSDNSQYVLFTTSSGQQGAITRNTTFHNHPFFAQWEQNQTQATFTALRLPDNGFFVPEIQNFRQDALKGYADSWPNNSANSALSLDAAIAVPSPLSGMVSPISEQQLASTITLNKIDFIHIVTAILQNNGPLGECSTEISSVQALHP